MQTDPKTNAPKKGRPTGSNSATKNESITYTIEGDEVVIRIPKKALSRKLLAELI